MYRHRHAGERTADCTVRGRNELAVGAAGSALRTAFCFRTWFLGSPHPQGLGDLPLGTVLFGKSPLIGKPSLTVMTSFRFNGVFATVQQRSAPWGWPPRDAAPERSIQNVAQRRRIANEGPRSRSCCGRADLRNGPLGGREVDFSPLAELHRPDHSFAEAHWFQSSHPDFREPPCRTAFSIGWTTAYGGPLRCGGQRGVLTPPDHSSRTTAEQCLATDTRRPMGRPLSTTVMRPS